MIVSKITTLNSRLSELEVYLTKRKYLLKLIEDVIAKERCLGVHCLATIKIRGVRYDTICNHV